MINGRRLRLSHIFAFILILGFLAIKPQTSVAQDLSKLGGDLTSTLPGRAALQVAAPNVTDKTRRNQQLLGFSPFHRVYTKEEGLGKNFTNNSCGGCHVDNGKGPLDISGKNFGGSTAIVKIGLLPPGPDGYPRKISKRLGGLIPLSSEKKVKKFGLKLKWTDVEGEYSDGVKYSLRKPTLKFRLPERFRRSGNDKRVVWSLRMTPPLIGMGLLEAIPESTIYSWISPKDDLSQKVIGRPNYATDARSGRTVIGRFGYKASQPTVEQQSAGAFLNDMNMSSEMLPPATGTPVIDDETLFRTAMYIRLGGMPPARDIEDYDVVAGRKLFEKIGCNACHITSTTTGAHSDPELENQKIQPFTNLLLHDMGRDLNDRYPEANARGPMWRTAPLWGLGFTQLLADESVRPFQVEYLHDGRARTVEEAILWHGGEASESQKRFKDLLELERMQLIKFLKSL